MSRSRLTIDQSIEGINAAVSNGQRLLRDAHVLFAAERFEGATHSAALAIEEAGKVTLLMEMLTCPERDLPRLWRALGTHTEKNAAWVIPVLSALGAKHFADFAPSLLDRSNRLRFERIKQRVTYTDHDGTQWQVPSIRREAAVAFLEVADATVNLAKPTDRPRIDLYLKHMEEPLRRGSEDVLAAIDAFSEEAANRGFIAPRELAAINAAMKNWPLEIAQLWRAIAEPVWQQAERDVDEALLRYWEEAAPLGHVMARDPAEIRAFLGRSDDR